MKKNRKFLQWLNESGQWVVALLAFLEFAMFAVVSLVQTCRIDIHFSKDNFEHVSFLNDNILLNLVVLAALVLLAVLMMRVAVKPKTVVWVSTASIAVTAAIGVWWVISSKSLPSADSRYIVSAAQELIRGNNNVLLSTFYFKTYPFQTGYLLFAEGFLRLFGINQLTLFQLLNVLFVVLTQIAILRIARELFCDPRVELLTAILLCLCLQPVLLSVFLYGTIPGMALSVWSLYFIVHTIRKKRASSLIPAAVLIAIAILLKKNYWIVLIAESVMLLLFALREKKWIVTVFFTVAISLSFLLPAATQRFYEVRAGEPFGKGTPQMAWLVTGFRDSSLCAGWYNGYTNYILSQNNYDYDVTLAQCKTDFAERADIFLSRPIYFGSFFYHKIMSQWNEPEFQTIWVNAIYERSGEATDLVKSICDGEAGLALEVYFNQLMQLIYAAMAFAFFVLFRKKEERDEARMIIPMILLGAAIYHALFEAKSLYAVIYVPMMLPYAAYGIKQISELVSRKKKIQSPEE